MTDKENNDSPRAIDLISSSEIGEVQAYQALTHLFPSLGKELNDWKKDKPFETKQNKVKLIRADCPVCHKDFVSQYFKLTLDNSTLRKEWIQQFKLISTEKGSLIS